MVESESEARRNRETSSPTGNHRETTDRPTVHLNLPPTNRGTSAVHGPLDPTEEHQAVRHGHPIPQPPDREMSPGASHGYGSIWMRVPNGGLVEYGSTATDALPRRQHADSLTYTRHESLPKRISDASTGYESLRGQTDNQQDSQAPLSPLQTSTSVQQLPLQVSRTDYVQDWIQELPVDPVNDSAQSGGSSTSPLAEGSNLSGEAILSSSFTFRAEDALDLVERSERPVTSRLRRQLANRHRYTRSVDSQTMSDTGSGISTPSVTSNYSFRTHASSSPRTGRKRKSQDPVGDRYHCIWCGASFKKPSDWRRHEESLHAPQFEWYCLAEGAEAIVPTPKGEQKVCAMCWIRDPPADHTLSCPNDIARCMNKPLRSRKFDRKDHMVQHLQRCHNVDLRRSPVNFSSWRKSLHSDDTAPLWDCGICDEREMKWTTRYHHVQEHVKKNQSDLTYWRRCICTQGYSPTLQATLDRLGFGAIFARKCRPLWFCPSEDLMIGRSDPSGNTPMYLTALSAQSHHSLKHNQRDDLHPYSCCTRRFQFPIQKARNVPFWCGLCETVIESPEVGSYDCLIVHHIDRKHIMEGDPCHSWKTTEGNDLNDFRTSLKQCHDLTQTLRWEMFIYHLSEMQPRASSTYIPFRRLASALREEMRTRQASGIGEEN